MKNNMKKMYFAALVAVGDVKTPIKDGKHGPVGSRIDLEIHNQSIALYSVIVEDKVFFAEEIITGRRYPILPNILSPRKPGIYVFYKGKKKDCELTSTIEGLNDIKTYLEIHDPETLSSDLDEVEEKLSRHFECKKESESKSESEYECSQGIVKRLLKTKKIVMYFNIIN